MDSTVIPIYFILFLFYFFLPFVFSRQQACKPLDIPSLLANSMRSQPVADRLVPRSSLHWKLIISLPEGCKEGEFTESDRGRFMSFVIKEKFKRGVYPLAHSIPQGLKRKVS